MTGPSDAKPPLLIDWSWWLSYPLAQDGRALLFYTDGTVRFKHRCHRGDRGVVVCAPALKPGHQLNGVVQTPSDAERLTITPSILCPDCGTHGFVRNGRWEAA